MPRELWQVPEGGLTGKSTSTKLLLKEAVSNRFWLAINFNRLKHACLAGKLTQSNVFLPFDRLFSKTRRY